MKTLCKMKEGVDKRQQLVRFQICDMSRTGKSIETKSKLVVATAGSEGRLKSDS